MVLRLRYTTAKQTLTLSSSGSTLTSPCHLNSPLHAQLAKEGQCRPSWSMSDSALLPTNSTFHNMRQVKKQQMEYLWQPEHSKHDWSEPVLLCNSPSQTTPRPLKRRTLQTTGRLVTVTRIWNCVAQIYQRIQTHPLWLSQTTQRKTQLSSRSRSGRMTEATVSYQESYCYDGFDTWSCLPLVSRAEPVLKNTVLDNRSSLYHALPGLTKDFVYKYRQSETVKEYFFTFLHADHVLAEILEYSTNGWSEADKLPFLCTTDQQT